MNDTGTPQNENESSQTAELAAALAKAQGMMGAASKDGINPHFESRYATLAAVIAALREPLSVNALSYTQTTEYSERGLVLITTLRHGGEWIRSIWPLPDEKTAPQKMGSALTYARRYALMSIVGIAPDDDDGNAATNGKGKHVEHTGEVINDQQADIIRGLLQGKNIDTFLKWAKVESISDIYTADYDFIVAKLSSSKKQAMAQ